MAAIPGRGMVCCYFTNCPGSRISDSVGQTGLASSSYLQLGHPKQSIVAQSIVAQRIPLPRRGEFRRNFRLAGFQKFDSSDLEVLRVLPTCGTMTISSYGPAQSGRNWGGAGDSFAFGYNRRHLMQMSRHEIGEGGVQTKLYAGLICRGDQLGYANSCKRSVGFGFLRSEVFAVSRILSTSEHDGRKRSGLYASTVRAVAQPVEIEKGFEEMLAGTKRKYYMLGGKGGVGKTSMAASLAVKFANSGHPTLVVSTDPAHSLSDSFSQDLSGGLLMPVEGPNLPLFAMEINPEQTRKEFRDSNAKGGGGGGGVQDFMDSMGLGGWVEQLSELKLGELLDTPPPGLDEAIAISKVVQFIQSPEYSHFTRIVFDTAPTGHTLRLLSLPDFLEASIGKILKLKQKLSSATNAVKSIFGQGDGKVDSAADKLEKLKERMVMVREIFRDKDATEFIIVTIPTVMAVSESSRLRESLKKEGVPVNRLIVNQILPPSSSDCKFCAIKRKDQQRAMDIVRGDPNLADLELIEAPLFDVEIRGVPALTFMGNVVWKN